MLYIKNLILEEIQLLFESELSIPIRSDMGNIFSVYKNPANLKNMSPEIRGISNPNHDFYVVDDTTKFKEILHDDLMEYLIKHQGFPYNAWYDGSTNGYYAWIKMGNTNTLHPSMTIRNNNNFDKEFFENYVNELNQKHSSLKFSK